MIPGLRKRNNFAGSIESAWATFQAEFKKHEEVDMYGLLCSMPFRTGPTPIQQLREQILLEFKERDEFLKEVIEKADEARELVYAIMMLEKPQAAKIPVRLGSASFVANDLHFMRTYVVSDWYELWLQQYQELIHSLIESE